jgi:dCMP deaminase
MSEAERDITQLSNDMLRPGRADDGEPPDRPEHLEYFMGIALAVRERANCLGRRVGAVLVVKDRLVAAGYNGTPMKVKNCDEGGCDRCAHPDQYESGTGYDVCICVHAEQNALMSAARFGIPVEGAVIFTTVRPCFGCMKELLQAKVEAVFYLHDWEHPDEHLRAQYEILRSRFPGGVDKVEVDDPREDWARGRSSTATTDTGHPAGGA